MPLDEAVQADLPDVPQENKLYIRANERVELAPKVPPEPSPYMKGTTYSRAWILQDGRYVPEKGSEMKAKYKTPDTPTSRIGVRKRMLTDFFWEKMLEEVTDEMAKIDDVSEYCTEYYANYTKDNFVPKTLEQTADIYEHMKYPLYGAGSSPITFYSETIKKTGPGEITDKFRKCQDFSKPMDVRLDNGWVL